MTSLTLSVLPHAYAVCRLAPDAEVPIWASSGDICSITRTPDELSIVCAQNVVPADVLCERDWSCLKVVGPLDFALVGILSSLTAPLAEAGISIFALSTYDTDYLLVNHAALEQAVEVLQNRGFEIVYS